MLKRSMTGIFGPRASTVNSAADVEKKLDEVLRRRTAPPPTPVPPPLPPQRALAITVDDDEAVTQRIRWFPSLHPR